LHHHSATATVFNSVTYSRLWWRHWGTAGTLQLWLVWDEDELVGVAPLYETADELGMPVLRFVGGVEVSDYLDVVTEPEREAEVVAALLEGWAGAPCRCPIDLRAIPHASPAREAFLRLAPAAGFSVVEEQEEVCPVITLPATWEAYLEGLESKQRRELRRKMRRAGKEALVTWYHVASHLVEEEMEHFFRLHALSDPRKARFMTPEMRAFFLDLALAFNARGWLDLSFLLVDGRRAATSLNFLFRNEVWLYNSGFDPAVGSLLSPGWLLLSYGIEEAIAEGRTRYDFLQGDEEYKYHFGGESEPVYQIRLERY
ncbi:MAG: GNAT family N-acetyltransferase, partial [Chloroflexota bacterium]|nr:GNAT family N-acetyltransferase [Chloroflexota bacterium]